MLPKDGSWNIGIAWPGLSELLKKEKEGHKVVRGIGEGPGRSWKRVGEWI